MEHKVGVYVCTGCDIGQCLKTDDLVKVANEEFAPAVVRTGAAFCLEDVDLIKGDIAKGEVDRVVVAACSPRVNRDILSFENTPVERVNLREQVVWSHPPNTEETQSLAEDYIRMGIVRADKTGIPTPYVEANERTLLVVGGGVAGMAAAIDAARTGFRVVLVEKAAALGGFARKLYKRFPTRPPWGDLVESDLAETVQAVEREDNITVYLSSQVDAIEGQPGNFSVTIGEDGTGRTITVGAVVLATGWKPYDATEFESYGFGRYANVITSVALEEMASAGKIARPTDGAAPRSVAIIQCEGAADEKHLPYSGNVTSLVSLKQARYLRQLYPDATVYIFYQDMQTPGQYEYFYREVQSDDGILLSQGEVQSVSEGENGSIVLEINDTTLGGGIRISADLLVLSIGMMPAGADSDALNLGYLQGSELPQTKFGFADSHFICFPYETRRTGIYSSGCARGPMDMAASQQDGTAAALKAIQCIENSSAGSAVHPRTGDLSFPDFFMQKCTSCGRCSQECPFGALEVDENGHPSLDPNRCRRCGICMGACPVQIISFDDYSVDMLSSMIRAVEIPEDDDNKLRILVLACENDAYPALDAAGINRLDYPVNVRVVPVRCLGSVNGVLIADAMSKGFDGVALMGCKSGEDYQCHFIQGSELLGQRMENVRETLERLALEPERVQVTEVAINEYRKIPEMLEDFAATIAEVGPNPFKGF